MQGFWHCTQFRSGMNGANHQDEAGGRPIWFCPEDEMKIWWGCRVDLGRVLPPAVAELAATNGLEREEELWRKENTGKRAIMFSRLASPESRHQSRVLRLKSRICRELLGTAHRRGGGNRDTGTNGTKNLQSGIPVGTMGKTNQRLCPAGWHWLFTT
jgi:hypothetical protein